MFDFDIAGKLAAIPGIIIALSVFCYAEARMAVWLGDPTPRLAGRLTMSPLNHLDLVGTVLIFLIGFGWPKPVPINPSYFKDPRKDLMLVTFAGPVMGLVTGFVFMLLYVLLDIFGLMTSTGLVMVMRSIVLYCIGIAIFCLIPFPPLPGFNLILPWLPADWQIRYYRMGWFNLVFLLILINTPVLGALVIPLQRTVFSIYYALISGILGLFF